MAPNATATKSANPLADKNLSRQPSPNSVWRKYRPNGAGLLSFLSSNAIHALVIGGAVLWSTYLAYWFGFARPAHSLPVEPVQFAAGDVNGPGAGPRVGPAAPREEGGDDPKSLGHPSDQDVRPSLTDPKKKDPKIEFPQENSRALPERLNTKPFSDLDIGLHKALYSGIPSGEDKDKDGLGKGDGKDKGVGNGPPSGAGKLMTEREKRMLRWSLKFNTRNGDDYLHQLDALGAILVIPDGPNGSFKVIRELSKRPPPLLDEDLSKIERIWWTDADPRSVKSLMEAMKLPNNPDRVVAFIPADLESDLAKKELAYKDRKVEQIGETTFAVVPLADGKCDVRVIDQKEK